VEFGTSSSTMTNLVTNWSLVTSHRVAISGLKSSTTYYYRVRSADAAGNAVIDPLTGGARTFKTLASTAVLPNTIASGAGTFSMAQHRTEVRVERSAGLRRLGHMPAAGPATISRRQRYTSSKRSGSIDVAVPNVEWLALHST
jgi:hypothetical protein